ncbi:MAG: FAD-binding protein [Eggerthellaceae bacterium]|nr:FAD-binding protein [Eggerthellaceae bacterium]
MDIANTEGTKDREGRKMTYRKLPQDNHVLSRRSFVKGGTAAALTAGVLGLNACSPGSDGSGASSGPEAPKGAVSGQEAPTSSIWALEPVGEPTETITAEVVVIGGGGTGIAASLQASQLGLDTILVERGGTLGGAWVCTEGMFAVGSHLQQAMGIDFTMSEVIEDCMQFHHFLPAHSLYEAFFSQTAETVKWAEDFGAKITTVATIGTGYPCFHVYQHGDEWKGTPGKLFIETLGAKTEELGTTIMLDTTARKLVLDNGKVSGVIIEKKDGTIVKIEAPVAIIATGGYGQNEEMLKELTKSVLQPHDLGVPGREGDGLKMGVDAGATLWDYQGTVLFSGPVVRGTSWGSYIFCLSNQPTLWLNQDCDRIVREDVFLESFAYAGNAVRSQERLLNIFTEDDLKYFEGTGPYVPVFTFIAEETPMDTIRADLGNIKDDYDSVYIADSIEDLAAQADLDPVKLKATLDRYNELCGKGKDEDFGKDPRHLRPMATGPYYALECQVGVFGTCSGLNISDKMECMAVGRRPIPGLYAGGNDAGGLMGDTYDVNVATGSMASWALNSGRIAAKSAAEYLGK